MFASPTTAPLPPPSNPILILGGGAFSKRTDVLDISGGDCSVKIPKINRNVLGLSSANLQSVFDTLVLCNVRIPGSDRLCMGAKKSSSSWVVLPPKLPPFRSKGASTVIGDEIVLIGDSIIRINISKDNVYIGDAPPPPNDLPDLFGSSCAVYDEENEKILYVNGGMVYSLNSSLDFDWVLESSKFFKRESVGCNILKVGGKMQLWVAGGESDFDGFAENIVEVIDIDDLEDGEPRVIDKMKLGHVRPGVSQVGEDVFVVGGVEKFKAARFIEKWNGNFWEVSPLACTKFGLQSNMNAAFLTKEFCED